MVDPLSLAAVSAAVHAAFMGAATETGKQAVAGLGPLARRLLGRPVEAPAGHESRAQFAQQLLTAALEQPRGAEQLQSWVRCAGRPALLPGTGTGRVARSPMPATTRYFTDRERVFKEIGGEEARTGFGARAVCLTGPEGSGTTAAAVHYAAEGRERFPDPPLYADFRGTAAGDGLRPAEVLRQFLCGLGAAEGEVPATQEDREHLYREGLSGRKLLVILDHVTSAAQAAPFLVDEPRVLTLITTRHQLSGLEARTVRVPMFDYADSRELMVKLLGKPQVKAAGADGKAAIRHFGGSPHDLTLFAERVRRRPGTDWSDLLALSPATEPAAEEPGLSERTRREAAALYEGLDSRAACFYRHLALLPGRDFGTGAAAAVMADMEEDEAATLLPDLARRRLLEVRDGERYHFRPELRDFADEAASREERLMGRVAAVRRILDWYLRLAVRNDYAALPQRWRLGPLYELHRGREVSASESREALDTLRTERANLVDAVRVADEHGDPDTVLQLCEALWALLLKTGCSAELETAFRTGAKTADTHCPDSAVAGRMHTQLAYVLGFLERRDEAEREQRAAAVAERAAGHRLGLATAVEGLGVQLLGRWKYAEAAAQFEEALAVLETVGEGGTGGRDVARARAICTYHLGRAARGLGRWDTALERFADAREQFRAPAVADRFNEAKALTGTAETLLDSGDAAGAYVRLDEASETLGSGGGAEVVRRVIDGLRSRCAGENP